MGHAAYALHGSETGADRDPMVLQARQRPCSPLLTGRCTTIGFTMTIPISLWEDLPIMTHDDDRPTARNQRPIA